MRIPISFTEERRRKIMRYKYLKDNIEKNISLIEKSKEHFEEDFMICPECLEYEKIKRPKGKEINMRLFQKCSRCIHKEIMEDYPFEEPIIKTKECPICGNEISIEIKDKGSSSSECEYCGYFWLIN